jgi:tRNA modification GTPase
VRHRVALERAAEALDRGRAAWRAGLPLDLYAEALREAGAELDAISGRTTAEDLLTRIFAAFCIGK